MHQRTLNFGKFSRATAWNRTSAERALRPLGSVTSRHCRERTSIFAFLRLQRVLRRRADGVAKYFREKVESVRRPRRSRQRYDGEERTHSWCCSRSIPFRRTSRDARTTRTVKSTTAGSNSTTPAMAEVARNQGRPVRRPLPSDGCNRAMQSASDEPVDDQRDPLDRTRAIEVLGPR